MEGWVYLTQTDGGATRKVAVNLNRALMISPGAKGGSAIWTSTNSKECILVDENPEQIEEAAKVVFCGPAPTIF